MMMKWNLLWTLHADGTTSPQAEQGLRNLQECRARLHDIRQEADANGHRVLNAHAMPEMACGTVRLLGMAPMGVARCGAL